MIHDVNFGAVARLEQLHASPYELRTISKTARPKREQIVHFKALNRDGCHKTSVSLEDAFWTDLREIAHESQVTMSSLVAGIDEARPPGNLSSAIRLFDLEHWHNKSRA